MRLKTILLYIFNVNQDTKALGLGKLTFFKTKLR